MGDLKSNNLSQVTREILLLLIFVFFSVVAAPLPQRAPQLVGRYIAHHLIRHQSTSHQWYDDRNFGGFLIIIREFIYLFSPVVNLFFSLLSNKQALSYSDDLRHPLPFLIEADGVAVQKGWVEVVDQPSEQSPKISR